MKQKSKDLGTIVVLVAPKFSHAAIGLCDALRRQGYAFRVVGIGYVGSGLTGPEVVKRCGGDPEDFIDTDELEKSWAGESGSCIDGSFDCEDWEEMARVRLADRQIGADYVLGALRQHSGLIDMMRADPWKVDHFQQRLLQACVDLETRYKPDLYIVYWVAGGWARGLEWVAAKNDKPLRSLNRYKLKSGSFYWSEIFGRRYPERLAGRKSGDDVVHEVETAITAIAERGDSRNLAEQRLRELERKSRYPVGRVLGSLARGLITSCIPRKGGEALWLRKKVVTGFDKARRLHHRWLSYRRIGGLSSEPEEQPYVLYALHIDPEASTMVKAPWHTNQLSVIEQASKALPPGWKLVVKENLPCIGIRPAGFYGEISRFHNVRLLPPAANTGEWMDRSRIVLSITGTVAWEALIKGKPVVLVGETELSSLSRHLVYEPDLGRLAPALQRALTLSPVSHAELARFLAPLAEVAFPAPLDRSWGPVNADTVAGKPEVFDPMADQLVESFNTE